MSSLAPCLAPSLASSLASYFAPPATPFRRVSGLASALWLASTVVVGASVSVQALAQTQIVPPVPQSRLAGPAALLVDPPARVARLAEVSGQVWFYSPDAGEWIVAARNRPVTSADRLGTEAGARAELQLGSTTVRLDVGSELEVRTLDDERFTMFLHKGSVAVQVRDDEQASGLELVTDTGRFELQRAGLYRLDRTSGAPGASFVSVLDGQARYEGPNSGLTIAPGRRAEFWLDAAGTAQYRQDRPADDAFAAWNRERDRVARRSDSVSTARYVSPLMTGAADLDRYGQWDHDADYGPVWTPRGVDARWAPYSAGRWAWVQPWGWTWVDDAPWGFAPFHYGRWVQRRNSWCWVPGQRVLRPVYAPALVAWVGGPSVQVSISIGGRHRPEPLVGWFPLAPREVFMPGYRSSSRYIQNINITHVTNVTQITQVINNPQAPREFRYHRQRDAVTVVPAAVISTRQPVASAAAQLRNAPGFHELRDRASGSGVQIVAPVAGPTGPMGPSRREAGPGDGRSDARAPGRFDARIDQRGIAPAPEGVGPQPYGPPPPQGVTPPSHGPTERRPDPSRDASRRGDFGGEPWAGPQPQPQPQPQVYTPPSPPAIQLPTHPRPLNPPRDGRERSVVPQPAPDGPQMRALPMPLPSPSQPARGDERRFGPHRSEAPALAAPPPPQPPPPRPAPERAGGVSEPRGAVPAPANANAPMGPVAPVSPVSPVPPVVSPARSPTVVRPAAPESTQRPELRPPARVEAPRDGQREDRRDDKRIEPREAR